MRISRIFFIFFLLVLASCASVSEKKQEIKQTDVQEVSEAEKFYSFAFEHMKQKNYNEAIPLLEKAIKADPSYVDAYLALRQVYLEVGDTSKAFAICTENVGYFPDPESNRKMAKAIASLYAMIGEPEKAELLFKKVIKEFPEDANSYDLYASYLESQGRYDEALNNYKKAYKYKPDDGGVVFRLGKAYF